MMPEIKNRKCKKCNSPVDYPQYPENELCKECQTKFRENALKCKICEAPIEWHNYHWHGKQCDNCYDSWKNT